MNLCFGNQPARIEFQGYGVLSVSSFVCYFMSLFLLATAPTGLLAAHMVVVAGNSSFTPLLEESFWTSSGGNYTFGFQAISGGEDFLLSIWRSKDPNKTAIWWPVSSHDVDYDPLVKKGSTFHFTSKGSLELHNADGSLLWSTNTTSSHAALLNTGNLLVYENALSEASWESFDDSRDSFMLAGLDVNRLATKPLLLQSRKNQSSYAIGPFHLATDSSINVYLHKLDQLGNDFIYLYGKLNIDGGFWIGRDNGKNYTNSTALSRKRLSLDYDGNVRVYNWEADVGSWEEKWQFVTSKCWLGSPCGPFGICQVDNGEINCTCPTDFRERVAGVPSQGCESTISFNASCGTLPKGTNYSATMVEMPHVDYNYNDLRNAVKIDMDECKQSCLDSCADCMAATYNPTQSQCFLKGNSDLGYLMNGRATNATTILLMKAVKEVPVNDARAKKKKGGGWVIGVSVAVVLIVVGSSTWLLCRRSLSTQRRNPKFEDSATGGAGILRFFRYDELVTATHNFSEDLGEGGYGTVYKGWMKSESKEWGTITTEGEMGSDAPQQLCQVAVKVLKNLGHGRNGNARSISYAQFKSEMNTLGKIHHVNLVSLLGYSYTTDGKERLLVYEFMEKGSLDKYLSKSPVSALKLPWRTCYFIALGTARGIAYLHHECNPPILHCDIKPHNVLLDANFTPKVADFGIAKRFCSDSHVIVSGLCGTRGYMAPEWLKSDEVTSKVDVYSFGVLLLELVNGHRQSTDSPNMLVEWAIQCISQAEMAKSVSHQIFVQDADAPPPLDMDSLKSPIAKTYDEVQQELNEKLRLLKVGLWCIQQDPKIRPHMSSVVLLIEGTTEMKEPPMTPPDVHIPSSPSLFDEGSQSVLVCPTNISYSVVSAR